MYSAGPSTSTSSTEAPQPSTEAPQPTTQAVQAYSPGDQSHDMGKIPHTSRLRTSYSTRQEPRQAHRRAAQVVDVDTAPVLPVESPWSPLEPNTRSYYRTHCPGKSSPDQW